MSLNNAALISGATMNAASGGAPLTFSSLGGTSLGQNTLIVPADTTLSLRRSMNVNASAAKANANSPGGYTQARQTLRFNVPRTLSNGNVSVDTVEIKLSTDVQTSIADKQEMLNIIAQTCIDADFTEFFTNQVID